MNLLDAADVASDVCVVDVNRTAPTLVGVGDFIASSNYGAATSFTLINNSDEGASQFWETTSADDGTLEVSRRICSSISLGNLPLVQGYPHPQMAGPADSRGT